MFEKIPVMASRAPVNSLINYFHFYYFFDITFHFWNFHEVLGSGLSLGPKKLAQNMGSLALN